MWGNGEAIEPRFGYRRQGEAGFRKGNRSFGVCLKSQANDPWSRNPRCKINIQSFQAVMAGDKGLTQRLILPQGNFWSVKLWLSPPCDIGTTPEEEQADTYDKNPKIIQGLFLQG